MVKKAVKKPVKHCMDVEFGRDDQEGLDAVVDKCGTRMKTSALRYGFYQDKD